MGENVWKGKEGKRSLGRYGREENAGGERVSEELMGIEKLLSEWIILWIEEEGLKKG